MSHCHEDMVTLTNDDKYPGVRKQAEPQEERRLPRYICIYTNLFVYVHAANSHSLTETLDVAPTKESP